MTAMEDTTAQLWFHETNGCRATPTRDQDWIQISDPNSLLVLTGREANRFGIADGMASNVSELESVLLDGARILDLRNEITNEKTSEFRHLVEIGQRRTDEFISAYQAVFAAIYQYRNEAQAWLGGDSIIIDTQPISDSGTTRLGKCANQIRTNLRRMRRILQENQSFRDSVDSIFRLDVEDFRRLYNESMRLRQRTKGDLAFSFSILRVIEVDLDAGDENE